MEFDFQKEFFLNNLFNRSRFNYLKDKLTKFYSFKNIYDKLLKFVFDQIFNKYLNYRNLNLIN